MKLIFAVMNQEIKNETVQDLTHLHSRKYLLAGVLLWKELHGRKMLNYRFERQRNLFGHIVDFYCYDLKLVILITKNPDTISSREQDLKILLEKKQIQVIQFDYNKIIDDLPAVLNTISSCVQSCRREKGTI